MDKLLEAGKIVNTHGIHGEVKIQPWADSPEFIMGFTRLFINGEPVKVIKARVHKNCVIAQLDGVTDVDGAIRLKNKIISVDREEAQPGEGRFFVADLIGLRVLDDSTGDELGVLTEILNLPANDVYVIKTTAGKSGREILVPAVPEFIMETNLGEGVIRARIIEGM